MNSRLLIDAIVRQTTVLVAQLSTAAGIRAPLAHVVDEVFVSLAREIEAQGVGRKVAADMFGVALRTYQKKLRRLTESVTQRERTLWEALLDYITDAGSVSRRDLLRRFAGDGEREVIAVLADLVSSGLVHAAGRGTGSVYGVTTDVERRMLADAADVESIAAFAWIAVRATPGMTRTELAEFLRVELGTVRDAVRRLVADGRLTERDESDDAPLAAAPYVILVGAEVGWEAAVADHFRAVANAIMAKVRQGNTRSAGDDVVGGTTLSFSLGREHPYRDRVHGLLARVRTEAIDLWEAVEAHNVVHPVLPDEGTRIWFYAGQYLETNGSEEVS